MVASSISEPTVSSTSRGGWQPNIEPWLQSGVEIGRLKSMGSGRSTRTPRVSSMAAKASSCSLARSTVSCDRGPWTPRMSLSNGIFGSLAGSAGGMQQPSARPTTTWRSGSHSFQLFTTVFTVFPFPAAVICRPLRRASRRSHSRPSPTSATTPLRPLPRQCRAVPSAPPPAASRYRVPRPCRSE